jgi:hypothetical protein
MSEHKSKTDTKLGDDLLRSGAEIGEYLYPGDKRGGAKVRYHARELPLFRMGRYFCARKSELDEYLSGKRRPDGAP